MKSVRLHANVVRPMFGGWLWISIVRDAEIRWFSWGPRDGDECRRDRGASVLSAYVSSLCSHLGVAPPEFLNKEVK